MLQSECSRVSKLLGVENMFATVLTIITTIWKPGFPRGHILTEIMFKEQNFVNFFKHFFNKHVEVDVARLIDYSDFVSASVISTRKRHTGYRHNLIFRWASVRVCNAGCPKTFAKFQGTVHCSFAV